MYNAPFFTAWFCTNWLIFFYPLYLIVMLIHNKCKSTHDIVYDAFTDFRDKGFTFGKFYDLFLSVICCMLLVLGGTGLQFRIRKRLIILSNTFSVKLIIQGKSNHTKMSNKSIELIRFLTY